MFDENIAVVESFSESHISVIVNPISAALLIDRCGRLRIILFRLAAWPLANTFDPVYDYVRDNSQKRSKIIPRAFSRVARFSILRKRLNFRKLVSGCAYAFKYAGTCCARWCVRLIRCIPDNEDDGNVNSACLKSASCLQAMTNVAVKFTAPALLMAVPSTFTSILSFWWKSMRKFSVVYNPEKFSQVDFGEEWSRDSTWWFVFASAADLWLFQGWQRRCWRLAAWLFELQRWICKKFQACAYQNYLFVFGPARTW